MENEKSRRKYSRREMEVDLTFYYEGEKFFAQTVDLCEGGIGVMSEKEIEPGAEVEITFKNRDDYTIRGIVKWSTQISKGSENYFRIGIETGKTGLRF